MVIIWIILGALLLWEIQSVWYAKHWDEELFVCPESKISGVEAIGI